MSSRQPTTVDLKRIIKTRSVLTYSINRLYNNINKKLSLNSNPTYYEVIKGKCRPYIDYDLITDKDAYSDDRINSIKDVREKLEGEEYILFDSSGLDVVKNKWKISLRIIFNNIYFNQGTDMVGYISNLNIPNVDLSVYKKCDKMQLMRLPYTSKEKDLRLLKKL